VKETIMFLSGSGKRLTIYVGESDSWRGRSLYMSILETLRQNGIAGATVTRGLAGYGAHSRIRSSTLEYYSTDLPVIISVIDTPEAIERAAALVKPMVREGLITIETVEIVKYTHRHLQLIPAERPVSDIMTREVMAVGPETPALKVIELLLGKLFKAVPVIDANRRVLGLITSEDLLAKAGIPARLAVGERLEAGDLQAYLERVSREKIARDIMTQPAETAPASDSIGHTVQRMLQQGLKRLPVIDAEGKLVGMVSRVDVLRAAAGGKAGEPERAPASRGGQTLAEVMTPRIPVVQVDDDLVDVLQQMLQSNVKRLIVLDERGQAIGIITDGDVVARVSPVERQSVLQALAARVMGTDVVKRGQVTARELMSQNVLSAPGETPVVEAINLMLREGRKRLVVVDANGTPIGMVDRQTLLAVSLGN
jgi:CBS domain-containing protein